MTAALEYTATDGTKNYTKTATSRAYAAGDKVYFSQGNLQYKASTHTWRFAEHQYDFVGYGSYGNVYVGEVKSNNTSISDSYTGWIDLFGWGTPLFIFAWN